MTCSFQALAFMSLSPAARDYLSPIRELAALEPWNVCRMTSSAHVWILHGDPRGMIELPMEMIRVCRYCRLVCYVFALGTCN